MRKRRNRRRRKQAGKRLRLAAIVFTIMVLGGAACILLRAEKEASFEPPDELLARYMGCIPKKKYKEMYQMIDAGAYGQISEKDFVKRNSAIYEGMEVKDVAVKNMVYNEEENSVQYQMSFDTVAGKVSFENQVFFVKKDDGYKLLWTDAVIYPQLTAKDRIRVSAAQAKRGEIFDRNGRLLAGKGVASSVGIVPGKLKERVRSIKRIADLLEIKTEDIKKELSAKWVREDSFVPLKTVKKIGALDRMALEPDAEILEEFERQRELLEIPGIMISDTKVRTYPYKEAAAHLVGYVQNVTAEDLEKHAGEGYTANSVIGRSGAEGLYERELKGQNGYRIYLADSDGNEIKEIACRAAEDGKDIKLTIDAELQKIFYEQYGKDKSCSAALDPYTGEVLALVSTPSFDSNDFVMGFSSQDWAALNEEETKPLYNRFRQVWCPGSAFKPIIAAIGLESGAVDPQEDYGNVGLSWQKDASWGSYFVTTLHAYEPVDLEHALIYSDNIYFAKAALKIGADEMERSLLRLGFQEELPFAIVMAQSQYSNTEHMETEIQLADSGYGQGQILINPLHMACLYTAFCNDGNVVQPYLRYRREAEPRYWISHAFSKEHSNRVLEGLKKVVNDANGTGYAAHREDLLLAGKTGTAEIKMSKEDAFGTELGWFAVFTAEKTAGRPILMISMVEDVKERGGSGYVVEKERAVIEQWMRLSSPG